jgi:hypothetical protein
MTGHRWEGVGAVLEPPLLNCPHLLSIAKIIAFPIFLQMPRFVILREPRPQNLVFG